MKSGGTRRQVAAGMTGPTERSDPVINAVGTYCESYRYPDPVGGVARGHGQRIVNPRFAGSNPVAPAGRGSDPSEPSTIRVLRSSRLTRYFLSIYQQAGKYLRTACRL